MGENLRVELRTRTPLWTGGAGGTMDRIHETGILGSLRWWYEAIVRGLGGTACDPASGSQKCQYNSRDRQSPEEQLCFACYVFGATGWRRRFSLKVVEDRTKPALDVRLRPEHPPSEPPPGLVPPAEPDGEVHPRDPG
ncbi:MAG: hypothetical protein KatS3mg131_1991 [Candidatus Tectimicrobiota bacterium]|nr:MAG: hypothetical protein KatS3mg131_1991 [Candidatus Tectomicrobia bacterium]